MSAFSAGASVFAGAGRANPLREEVPWLVGQTSTGGARRACTGDTLASVLALSNGTFYAFFFPSIARAARNRLRSAGSTLG
jgi:hypothetical protein